ncbi:MAG: pilus assembly protein [Anaerolineae bacterium]|nr:pilus assembly protein [Anaerolineae bacterium]
MTMEKHSNRRSKGQGLVEFALILPLLLLILLGIFEFGRVLFIYSSLFNAAREGARYGVTSPRNYGGISTRAEEFISLVPPEDVDIWVWYDNGPGTSTTTNPDQVAAGISRVNVQVQYDIEAMTPLFDPFIDPIVLENTAARTIQNVGLVVDPPPTVPPPGDDGGGGTPTATITLNPICGPAGAHSITITGSGWTEDDRVDVYFDTTQLLNNTAIDPDFTLTIYISDVGNGNHSVRVVGRSTGTEVTAPFAVPCADATNTPTPTPTPTLTPTPGPSPTLAPPTATPIPIADIIIQEPVTMGATAVMGTAQPGETVTLRIVQTGLQRSVVVEADGTFRFEGLPALEGGMALIVQGYGKQDSTVVTGGTATPTPTPTPLPTGHYITIDPECGPAGAQTVTVSGFNWPTGHYLMIYFDSNVVYNSGNTKIGTTTFQFTINVANATAYVPHTITAKAWQQQNGGGTQIAAYTVPFACPCPVPDLVVSSLELASTPPLGTFNKIDFAVNVSNQGGADIPSLFWVDLYESEDPDPLTDTSRDYIAINGLPAGASIDFTMWVETGFSTTGTHTITVLADTWGQIREHDELNNLSDPLAITVTQQNPVPSPTPTPAITPGPKGKIIGLTYMDMSPTNLVNVYVYDTSGRLIWSGFSRAETLPNGNVIDGYYEAELPPGDYTVVGQVRMATAIYRGETIVTNLQSNEIRQQVDINLTQIN